MPSISDEKDKKNKKILENNDTMQNEFLLVEFIDYLPLSSVQFSSVAQSCPTLCDPMNRSKPGLPVHHQLPKFTQTHVH